MVQPVVVLVIGGVGVGRGIRIYCDVGVFGGTLLLLDLCATKRPV
jgi:hypothetical protein